MANIKKIIGVLLALVMALSVVTVAFAAENDAYSITVTSDKATLDAGESATVTVKVTANFNVCTMQIPVFFDNTKVDVSEETCLLSVDADRVKIVTENSPTAYQMFEGSGYTKDNYGVRALVYVAQQGDAIRTYNNEAVMTFKVTAKENATGNVVFECLEKTIKTSINTSGTLYLGTCAPNEDNELIGIAEPVDNANIAGATTTINFAGGAEPADLELTAEGATDGVIIDTRITFGGQYAGVVYGFNHKATATFRTTTYLTTSLQATNGGTLEFSRSIGTVGYGTGTVITVKNADSTVSKTYVVVIFGDVNCDGLINVNDTGALRGYISSPATLTNLVVRMAANCQNVSNSVLLYNVNVNDTGAIRAYLSNSDTKVSQATLAATFNKVSVHNNYK